MYLAPVPFWCSRSRRATSVVEPVYRLPSPLPQDIGISLPVIKAAIIVGKKVLDAAETQFQAVEGPVSGGKHPRQAGGPSRCYRIGSGGHRRPGPAISIDAVMEQEQVG